MVTIGTNPSHWYSPNADQRMIRTLVGLPWHFVESRVLETEILRKRRMLNLLVTKMRVSCSCWWIHDWQYSEPAESILQCQVVNHHLIFVGREIEHCWQSRQTQKICFSQLRSHLKELSWVLPCHHLLFPPMKIWVETIETHQI